MFYRLVMRNSARDRRENGLFYASLLVTIAAFYIILALPRQDVMLFLAKMESNAVDRLLGMIPMFFAVSLFLLFFLVYFAEKYQMERRRHEFGVCLMMGMRRRKLFAMLFMEDLRGSLFSLSIGVPVAVLLSELIGLVTARAVGIGIIGHRFTFSFQATLGTAAGFLFSKMVAFLVLSGRIAGQEIGALLAQRPEGTKRQLPAPVYGLAMAAGIACLGQAYRMAIGGASWYRRGMMGLTLLLGITGTLLFFYGLRAVMGFLAKRGGRNRRLRVFHFRQLQENVIRRSNTLAVSSLLMLAGMCCFGAGVGIAGYYGEDERHVLDYTFGEYAESADKARRILEENGLDSCFSELFEMRLGLIRTTEEEKAFRMDTVLSALSQLPESRDKDALMSSLGYVSQPRLISLSGYNRLLSIAGLPLLDLEQDEAAVYMDYGAGVYLLDEILQERREVELDDARLYLTGRVQTVNLVTDRAIRLSFALILPDEAFAYYTQGQYSVYLNGTLEPDSFRDGSLMDAIAEMNGRLDSTELHYESYLQNMGRKLFYMVAVSYVTIYLAVIFLIIANTVVGVQFLMGQQGSGRRYRTLIRLGATHEVLCRSAGKQIDWYFGIPTAVAVFSSLFGVRALYTGLLPRIEGGVGGMMRVSAAMILLLLGLELLYVAAVRRSSRRYLLSLMVPEREE